mgnify:CR=1 FL=1
MSEEGSSEDDSSSREFLSTLSISKASKSDLDAILEIYEENSEYLDPEDGRWIESIISSRSRRVRIYVLRNGEEIIGFALVYKKRELAYIDAIAVKREFRGRGAGTYFLRSLEDILRREGVERIFLTVKHSNMRALTFYLKNMYRIKNTVLLMRRDFSQEDINGGSRDNDIRVVYRSSASISSKKLLNPVTWNILTEEADELVYRRSGEKRHVIYVYREGDLAGVVEYTLDTRSIIIERFAVSYYRSSESLEILIREMIRELRKRRSYERYREIILPIDATKTALIKTLTELGFSVFDAEYVLCKDLSEEE